MNQKHIILSSLILCIALNAADPNQKKQAQLVTSFSLLKGAQNATLILGKSGQEQKEFFIPDAGNGFNSMQEIEHATKSHANPGEKDSSYKKKKRQKKEQQIVDQDHVVKKEKQLPQGLKATISKEEYQKSVCSQTESPKSSCSCVKDPDLIVQITNSDGSINYEKSKKASKKFLKKYYKGKNQNGQDTFIFDGPLF